MDPVKNNNKKVRLLEVKKDPKPIPKVEKTEAQIENEKLQKMI